MYKPFVCVGQSSVKSKRIELKESVHLCLQLQLLLKISRKIFMLPFTAVIRRGKSEYIYSSTVFLRYFTGIFPFFCYHYSTTCQSELN